MYSLWKVEKFKKKKKVKNDKKVTSKLFKFFIIAWNEVFRKWNFIRTELMKRNKFSI